MQDVFAGSEGVLAVVGAGAVGFTAFGATEGDAVGSTAEPTGDEVVAPGTGGITVEDADFHLFLAGALLTVAESGGGEFFFVQGLHWFAFGWECSEPERDTVFEEDGECGSHVFAERIALRTEQLEAIASRVIELQGDHDIFLGQSEPEVVAGELGLFLNVVQLPLSTGEESLSAFVTSPEEVAGLKKSQP
jgi:hypothetical protein